MTRDRNYLISVYNATSTNPKGDDELETYEAWLERQLLSRIERLEKFEHLVNQEVERRVKERMPSDEDIRLEFPIGGTFKMRYNSDYAESIKENQSKRLGAFWLRSRLTCSEKPNNLKTEGGGE